MFYKLENWIKSKSGADVYYLAHGWRLNGVVDVWKNCKTVYCIPENEYQNFDEDFDKIVAYASDKLTKHEKREPIKKLKSGKMSMQEFRNNLHQRK